MPANRALFILRRQVIASACLNEHAQEEIEKVLILVGRRRENGLMLKPGVFQPDVEIAPAEGLRQHLVAGAEVEDEGQRVVFLGRLDDEIGGERFPLPIAPRMKALGTSPQCRFR